MGRFSAKVREIREDAGLKRAEFARRIGVSFSAVDQYEKGGDPGLDVLMKIAKEFKVSLDWLVFDYGEMEASGEELARRKMTQEDRLDLINRLMQEVVSGLGHSEETARDLPGVRIVSAREFPGGLKAAEFYALPLLSDAIAAGKPREVQDAATEGVAIVHRAWCPNPKESVFIRVRGDSMEPTIPDGALVVIDAAVKAVDELLGHPVAIALDDSESTIKRLRRNSAGQLVGMPDNPSPDNTPVNIKEEVRIVGLIRSVHAEVK